MTQMPYPYYRMNGLGNRFVVLDMRQAPRRLTEPMVRALARPPAEPPSDQVILLEPSETAHVFMRIYNADGGEVDACGNASRCVAWLLARETGEREITLETNAGRLGAWVDGEAAVTVDMGRPRLRWDEIPLAEEFADTRTIELQVGPIDDPVLHSPSAVNMGNPHCIFWVDDVTAHDLARIGPVLEHHPLFPERANISLAQVTGPEDIVLRVWERGAGLTKACGTAACAAAVAAARKGLTGRKVTVHLPGGPLRIVWQDSDDHVMMTGAIELEETGEMTLPEIPENSP